MDFVKNTVVFLPYVGSNYQVTKRTVFGKRLMFMGASHYCEHYCRKTGCGENCPFYGKYYFDQGRLYFGKKCEKFTNIVIGRYLEESNGKKEHWFKTFDKMFKQFTKTGEVSEETRKRILDNIIYFEYCEGAEGCDPYMHNQKLMEDFRNYQELENVVAQYKPNVLVVHGARVKKLIAHYAGVKDPQRCYATRIAGQSVDVLNLKHPADRYIKDLGVKEAIDKLGIKLV